MTVRLHGARFSLAGSQTGWRTPSGRFSEEYLRVRAGRKRGCKSYSMCRLIYHGSRTSSDVDKHSIETSAGSGCPCKSGRGWVLQTILGQPITIPDRTAVGGRLRNTLGWTGSTSRRWSDEVTPTSSHLAQWQRRVHGPLTTAAGSRCRRARPIDGWRDETAARICQKRKSKRMGWRASQGRPVQMLLGRGLELEVLPELEGNPANSKARSSI